MNFWQKEITNIESKHSEERQDVNEEDWMPNAKFMIKKCEKVWNTLTK